MHNPLPDPQVLRHVVDVHCHPTDALIISQESIDQLPITICAMSSRPADQPLVRELASSAPSKVVACFGYHPWFSASIATDPTISKEDHYRQLFLSPGTPNPEHIEAFTKLLPLLPDPIPLDGLLLALRRDLLAFPGAMLGEVGLDRSFRMAYDYFAEPRELTPFTMPIKHQLAILEAQLDIAVELKRNVSIHSVKSQAITVELLDRMNQKHGKKWNQISIDLHSCGLKPETWRDIARKHSNVFLSLSTAINGRSSNHRALIAACPDDRILVESDYPDIDACAQRTWDMVCIVAEVKGWLIERTWEDHLSQENWGVVRRLERNWLLFQQGNHKPVRSNKRELLASSSEDDSNK